ncbi:MAG: SUMF1/EgtB/PvdO family nonheme iron enzyme [Myxococcota bacterium]
MDRKSLTLLHLSDPQFGEHHRFADEGGDLADSPDTLFGRLRVDLDLLRDDAGLHPEVVVITGDLAEQGKKKEFGQVARFAAKLEAHLDLGRHRILVLPGNHDINRKLCEAYFNECEGEDEEPVAPYWPKWKHYAGFFRDFYADVKGYEFTEEQPWTLFEIPELSLVVAGFNSTMEESHRDGDHYGHVGERQLGWFEQVLREYEGWFRIGAVHHNVVRGAVRDDEHLHDADVMRRLLGPRLNLVLHGHRHEARIDWWGPTLPILSTGSAAVEAAQRPEELPNQYQFIRVEHGKLDWWTRMYAPDQKRFVADTRLSTSGNEWAHSQAVAFQNVDRALGDGASLTTSGASENASNARDEATVSRSRTTKGPSFEAELVRYRRKVVDLHDTVQLAGFDTRVRVPIKLDELYVPLDVMPDLRVMGHSVFADADEAHEHVRKMARECDEVPLSEAFGFAARYSGRRGLVMLGDPGSGKTTQLQRLLLAVMEGGGPGELGLPADIVPVFLPLRNLSDPSIGLEDFVKSELAAAELGMSDAFSYHLVHEYERVLYLLDGLDEVPDEGARAQVSRWISRAIATKRDARFVVTCRYAGYGDTARLSEGFLELHLRPLTPKKSEQFVNNWFRIVEISLAADREQALVRAEQGAARLLEALRRPDFRSARVATMTRNPLLLTTICLVHRDRGRLPQRRVELYDECVKVLLERWREAKDLPVSLPAAQARRVLQPVARWLHEEEGRRQATAQELRPVLEEALAREGGDRGHQVRSPTELLRSIRDESGLLTGWSGETYGFMHLGFQEYLASRELRTRGVDEPEVLAELASRFGEAWWQEVILLMLASQDEPPIFERFMRQVVQRPQFVQWAGSDLMGLCLEEARRVTATPFVELVEATGHGRDGELMARQVAALKLAVRVSPKALEPLEELLRVHPALPVRDWWQRRVRGREQGRGVSRMNHGLEMVEIPGGSLLMGSPHGVGHSDEWPQHHVMLKSFRLARYSVTNAQYEMYLRANRGAEEPEYWSNRLYNQPQQPVVGVSWHEASKYCEWAGLRLPTEAEWEYACRAGASTLYSFGDDEGELGHYGWHSDNSGGQLHPVGHKEPNSMGLYDMHGNVFEWCEDRYSENYEGAEHRTSDGLRLKPEGDTGRVVRGGGFDNAAPIVRSAYRIRYAPSYRSRFVGLRPAQGHPL